MTVVASEDVPTRVSAENGITLYHIKTDKFKTNTINVFFQDGMDRNRVTPNALLPAVLRRGCRNFPALQEIALFLDEQYGSVFDCGVAKKGERQILQFYMEYVADKYTGRDTGLFYNTFGLLFEILTSPVLENGVFKSDYVRQEKDNLRRLIEGRINDKAQYAVERCYEEMCRNEPFGLYEYGVVEDLEHITPENLFRHYMNFLERLPVDIFLTGSFSDDEITHVMDKFRGLKRNDIINPGTAAVKNRPGQVRQVTERVDVNQSKLCLGYRTNISANDPDYYRLLVYNSILGGGIQSKLFQNVREKAGLAYYVYSSLEKFKGLMLVSSGIDKDNRDKAIDIIGAQLEQINAGNISDYEYDSTVKYIVNGIRSLKDSQLQTVDFYLSQAVSGSADNFETLSEKVRKVKKADVAGLGNKIVLDTVYFLTTKE